MKFQLRYVAVSHLRGFRDARLDLRDGITLLVGPNNSGKTSILRLLDWVLNPDSDDAMMGRRELTGEEVRLLLPARATGRAARRLTLGVYVADGRSRRRLLCDGEIARIRVGVTGDRWARINLGPPHHGEGSDEANRQLAFELLGLLRATIAFTHIPASRDASSESFREALRAAAVAKLEQRALHAKRGGAPTEYRSLKKAREEINRVASELVVPLWNEMREAIPPGLVTQAELGPDIDAETLVAWLAERTAMRLVTGEHDPRAVDAVEVGSGLQSLLELAINRGGGVSEELDWIIALEEPEAFLHPAAQRALARILRQMPGRLIVSTHSPILVEEGRFGEVVLVRKHRFYAPRRIADDAAREEINTALLTGHGAEMAFSSSVLLVEGPGDQHFFERLRRRLAIDSGDGRVDELAAVPVGSKERFAPWLRLLRSYGEEGDRPIAWFVVGDDDAAQHVRRAYREAGLSLPREVAAALERQAQVMGSTARSAEVRTATLDANRLAERNGVRLALLPGALEGVMTESCSSATARLIGDRLDRSDVRDQNDLAALLTGTKAPWMRAVVGDLLPWDEVSDQVFTVLTRWLQGAVGVSDARGIIRGVRS